MKINQHVNHKKIQGFTLLELMMIVAIVGILAVIAIPSYQKYVNEAKAAEFLVKMHEISLAYHDIFATSSGISNQNKDLSSAGFGQPPAALPGLAAVYKEHLGLTLSSQLVNHSGHFGYTGHEEFVILFIKANTGQGLAILRALDHLTQFKHSFVSPSMMMIALAQPHEAHTSGGNTYQPVAVPNTPSVTPTQTSGQKPQSQPVTTTPQPSTLPPNPALPPNQGSQTAPAIADKESSPSAATGDNTGSSNQASTSSSSSQPLSPTASAQHSSAGSGLNWPPGWAKHPDKHSGPHPGHHNH